MKSDKRLVSSGPADRGVCARTLFTQVSKHAAVTATRNMVNLHW